MGEDGKVAHARNFLTDYLPSLAVSSGDLLVYCTDGALRTHRLLLAATSPMLREAMAATCESTALVLPDFTLGCFKAFLDRALTWSDDDCLVTEDDKDLLKMLHIFGKVQSVRKLDVTQLEDTSLTRSDKRSMGKRKKKKRKDAFKCGQCDKVLSSAYSLKQHRGMHLNNRDFVCKLCNKSFTQNSHLTVHLRTHTNERPFMCQNCGKTFSAASNLKKHCLIHERGGDNLDRVAEEDGERVRLAPEKDDRENGFECSDCQKVCSSRSALEKHTLTHTGAKPHRCQLCLKRFSQRSHLNHHSRTVHATSGQRDKTHFCSECGQTFTSSSSLYKHHKTHTNERPFKCEFRGCDKAFIQKIHLQSHTLKHTGERPYQCDNCGKSFTTRSSLKIHEKIHAGEKKIYVCTECDTQYVNLCDLQVHLRRHSGEAPFTCTFCPRRFRAARHLADHERTHTGQKPYTCKNCNKSFAAAGGLRLHFKRNDTCRLTSTSGAYAMKRVEEDTILEDDCMSALPQDAFGLDEGILTVEQSDSAVLTQQESLNFSIPDGNAQS